MKKMIMIIAVLLGASSPVFPAVHDLGVMGQTYPVAEEDAYDEIRNHAAKIDWDAKLRNAENIEKARTFRPDTAKLPKALADRTFYIEPVHTLENDITIPNGDDPLHYPAGYRFNPLEYVPLNRRIIVIDGSDDTQVAWLKGLPDNNLPTTICITDGDVMVVSGELQRPVFYAVPAIIETCRLAAVPSIVVQAGKMLEVTECAVTE